MRVETVYVKLGTCMLCHEVSLSVFDKVDTQAGIHCLVSHLGIGYCLLSSTDVNHELHVRCGS